MTSSITPRAQYDAVGEKYARFKRMHKPVPEEHTMRCLLGRLDGARVLDLACGFGHYTRLATELGAESVAGVDISGEMVALARRMEEEEPRGIAYHVHDAARLPRLGSFDVVSAVWLFNYATSPDNLVEMFASIRENLAPGGRLVAVTVGPDYDPHGASWEPYGLNVVAAESLGERTELVMELRSCSTRLTFSRWDREVYDQAARKAGFEVPSWRPVVIPDRLVAAKGDAYWQAYRQNPFVAAFECR